MTLYEQVIHEAKTSLFPLSGTDTTRSFQAWRHRRLCFVLSRYHVWRSRISAKQSWLVKRLRKIRYTLMDRGFIG